MTKLLHLLITAAFLAPALAAAQTTTVSPDAPAAQQVSQIAPQLIAFAGGQANFENLVNGLALGSPVTLVTALPNGQVQTVSFTPQGTMTATQVAQTLESTRQSLISRGIGAPSAQQVAIALAGGPLPTQTGTVQVGAMLPAANQPATSAAAGGSAPGTSSAVTTTTTIPVPPPNPNGSPSPAAILQGQNGSGTTPPSPAQIIQNNRGGNVSDSPTSGNVSNTPGTIAPTTGTTTAAPTTAPSATERPATGAVDRPAAAGTTAPASSSPATGR